MKRSVTFFMMLLLPLGLLAQSNYKISDKSTITIAGTSSLHDWTMQTNALRGDAEVEVVNGKLNDIRSLKMILAAESLKSGKSAMDKNAYATLKTDKYPNIQFKLSNINQLQQTNNDVVITASGVLTIAGFSRPEKIEVQGKIDKNGVMSFTGKKVIKMSQYGIEPPSFMFGTVTTGDVLNLQFNIVLSPNNQLLQ